MAEAVVSVVLERVGELVVQEAIILSGLKNEVILLQTELNLMQSLLKDADKRQDESEVVSRWVVRVRDLAYDADDIIGMYILEVSSKRGGLIQKILKRCGCILFLYEGISVHKAGLVISNITVRFSNLRRMLQDYGIRESTIQGGGSSSSNERERERRQTFPLLEHDVVGFDDDLNKLVEFLLKEGAGNRVASICGMGGLGKTTLAKMVYNLPEVKKHFEFCTWSYISQQCQRRRVWEEILIKVLSPTKEGRDEIQKLTDIEILEELHEVLCKKKCLVILDDIWDIETLKAFPMKNTSSKILLTSRIKELGLYADTEAFLCELQCLNMERSWELLEKRAIYWREDSATKFRMIKLGMEMVQYCGGLPLAIVTLGGILAFKQTVEEWEDVLRNVRSYIYKENLRLTKWLALSYYDLPARLKLCFLYLGHFPEDFEIPAKELIRMWMGEGFISQSQQGGREDTMEDVGERYLRELVQRCLVQVGKIDSLGKIKTCRIHDIMRDFCISKAHNENFLQIMNIHSMEVSEMHLGKIRRLAIIWEQHNLDPLLPLMLSKKYPYLRSLLCFQPHVSTSFNLLRSMFKNFKSLRVLNLENCHTHSGDLPEDIGCLIHLKFLSLKNTNIHNLPSSLGNLRWLQTLDVRSWAYNFLVRVPNVFKKMEQLRHLYLPKEYRVNEQLEIANLCCLLTLVNVELKTIQMATSFKFNSLQVLGMQVRTDNNEWAEGAIQILMSSSPHIYKLNLSFSIKKLPEVHQFPPNLVKLTLNGSLLKEDPMTTVEKLHNLKILRLFNDAFAGKHMICSERGFPLLQSIVVSGLNELEEWRVKEGAMPSLYHLKIENCSRLKMIPDGLWFVTTLQVLEINNMPESFKDRLNEGGPDFDQVKHVPSLPLYFNTVGKDNHHLLTR